MAKKKEVKVTELTKGKTRTEEEKFFIRFSQTQQTAVLLIILAATFMVQGSIRYLEVTNRMGILKPWFTLVVISLFFLTTSAVSTTLDAVISPLKFKRKINLISFATFILGFILFLASLLFLLFVI